MRLRFRVPLLGEHPVKRIYRCAYAGRDFTHVRFQRLVWTTVPHGTLDVLNGGARALHPRSEGSANAWKFTAVALSRFASPFWRPFGGAVMIPARIAAGTITSRS